MILPEAVLMNILTGIKNEIVTNEDSTIPDEEKILERLLGENVYGDFSYPKEARELFLRDLESPRYVKIKEAYDRDHGGGPTIHITLPDESIAHNFIGVGEDSDVVYTNSDGSSTVVKEGGIDSTYNLVITSSNKQEVLILYSVFKAALLSLMSELEEYGLENCQISGREIMMDRKAPENFYSRAIIIKFTYFLEVPELFTKEQVGTWIFNRQVYDSQGE